jgi:DNA-binding transcriptional ArsR family regulator
MENIGIKDFILNRCDFEITLISGRKCCVLFSLKKSSISEHVKSIEKKLWQNTNVKTGENVFGSAIADIEDQLIHRRDEIFKVSTEGCTANDVNTENVSKSMFKEDVTNLRNQFKQSGTTFQDWQSIVAKKYENLHKVVVKYYPEAWPFLEFCLAVKSILNIEDITLPFMGVILSAPASMKTLIIQLFRKYPGSFYSDNFTANSLVSHNSALTEEQLQQIDMLPKMKDKLILTPELAPVFTSKEDDLQKILGIITRILDGHGFESDSGAQGHRHYGDTMFVWIGAAVEIPFKVWKMLGSLGHKIYFLLPQLSEKTIEQLKQIAKTNDFGAKFREIEEALLDYLKYFDAAPENLPDTQTDKNGIIKIRWNHELEGEQDKATGYIAEVAKLLAHLRGSVYISEAKPTKKSREYDSNSSNNNQQQDSSKLIQIEGQDYDTALPIIEDPSRAVILLRNLAIGHAISQGRSSMGLQDIPIVIKVALSTAMVSRVKVFDLLLKKGGELKTSDITKGLRVSEPTVRRTMREFYALGIVDISAISQYNNAELKITLNSEYDWFKSQEFEKLREGFVPSNHGVSKDNNSIDSSNGITNNDYNNKAAVSGKITGLSYKINDKQQQDNTNSEACDCHTLKAKSPPETEENTNNLGACHTPLVEEEKSSNDDKSFSANMTSINSEESDSKIKIDYSSDPVVNNSNSEEDSNVYDNTQQSCDDKSIQDNFNNIQKINESPWESNQFQRVTMSQSHGLRTHAQLSSATIFPAHASPEEKVVLEAILDEIKSVAGSHVAVNAVISSAYNKNEAIRSYLGDKLTSRENRKVRDLCLMIIRHPNIEVVKYKPQLVVRWSSPPSIQIEPQSHVQPLTKNHKDEGAILQ